MLPPIQIPISGLQAAEKRLAASANNIANANTPDYVPQEVVQKSLAEGGVVAEVKDESQSDGSADGGGGVSLEEEVVNVAIASYDFKANLKVIERINEMSKKLLDIIS